MMTAWWRWSGNLKGREKRDDLKPHGEEQWKKNPGKRGRPAGRKSGAPAAQDRARWREKVTTLCASWRGENSLTNVPYFLNTLDSEVTSVRQFYV